MRKRTLLIGVIMTMIAAVVGVLALRLRGAGTIPLGVPSGELAFMSNQDGDWDIFVMDADGQIRNLTGDDSGGHDYFPSWSLTGEKINVLTGRTGQMGPGQVSYTGGDLRTLGITEAVRVIVLQGLLDWDPNWSPGGERVTWASLRDLNLEVYTAGIESDVDAVRLTQGAARDWFMVWSPDGAQIAFNSDRVGNEDIYLMDADGANMTPLTTAAADDVSAAWSLDGERLLFVSERERSLVGGQMDLFVMNTDGSDQRLLADDEVFRGDPKYSADGSEVIYMSNEAGDWNIYRMDADGSNVRRLTASDADELFPVWRPSPAESEVQ